jgi:hypothetical protein
MSNNNCSNEKNNKETAQNDDLLETVQRVQNLLTAEQAAHQLSRQTLTEHFLQTYQALETRVEESLRLRSLLEETSKRRRFYTTLAFATAWGCTASTYFPAVLVGLLLSNTI